MNDLPRSQADYRIEVSGWGLDDSFFVETVALRWGPADQKRVRLHRYLPEGATIFVRLLNQQSSNDSVPVAYQVTTVTPMNSNGFCEMELQRLRPRSKEPSDAKIASKLSEGEKEGCGETSGSLYEEVLR